jgi:flagellar biosynthesis regulator FlbT
VRCIAVPEASQWRIIWRDENILFANYGSPPIATPGYHLQSVQLPIIGKPTHPSKHLQSFAQQIYEILPQWADTWQTLPSAARIDRLIQAHRAYSLLPAARNDIAAWLDSFWR